MLKGLYRVTKPGGVCVWVVNDKIDGGRSLTSFRQAITAQEIGWWVHDVMIYHKTSTPFMSKVRYTQCYEFMHVFSKGKPKSINLLTELSRNAGRTNNGQRDEGGKTRDDGVRKRVTVITKQLKARTNVWSYNTGAHAATDNHAFDHPAIFPEKLAEDHILSWSNEGDIVLDPFCGSGTTLKMAAANDRQWIGIDISEDYLKIAEKRAGLATKGDLL